MLDYKTIIRLKTMGLNNLAIANGAKCKWDSVEPRLFFGVVFHFPAFYEGIVSSLYAAQKPSDTNMQGQLISIQAMERDYEERVGHPIGSGQIYRVLHRHGWRKVMPRSRHPKKASEEVIATSKKKITKSQS